MAVAYYINKIDPTVCGDNREDCSTQILNSKNTNKI